ncbi:type 1 glutamine amidotransferase domain-containing protein [Arthrobacter sp. H14]|uniref:type 1 glutamine amidotransferase domain-containing protein n=1 Tax=Arthrobacter sp. H14 TaxID=1312959 RepID=UPI0004790949|nr:type 1 glutamine amidotransferase domain-containing protein [Arthrobacter sp. H14]
MSEHDISGKKVAFLLTDGVEQVELTQPWDAVKQAGGQPVLVSPKSGSIKGFNHTDPADDFPVDVSVSEAKADDYDALVLPGGVFNADQIRVDKDSQDFTRSFFSSQKPVAVICHGPWIMIDAGVVSGRKMTSYHTLATDLKNAGAEWVDQEVVVDAGLVSSRNPDDLPAFCSKLVEEVAEGKHSKQTV